MIDLTERESEFLFDHFIPFNQYELLPIKNKLLNGCSEDYIRKVNDNMEDYGLSVKKVS